MYGATPDGMRGQMSAWFVLSALGFYPVDAVSGNYPLRSPPFENAVVDLGQGKQLHVEVLRKYPKDVYIQAFALNEQPQTRMVSSQRNLPGRQADVHHGCEAKPRVRRRRSYSTTLADALVRENDKLEVQPPIVGDDDVYASERVGNPVGLA